MGNSSEPKTLFEESVELFREAGDRWGVAESLNNLALTAEMQGEIGRATALNEESLRVRRELGDKRGIVMSLNNLGSEALDQAPPSEQRHSARKVCLWRGSWETRVRPQPSWKSWVWRCSPSRNLSEQPSCCKRA